MKKKELIVKTKYEELYKTEYGYWIEHIEYEDGAETVRFEGGGCSISNEVVDKLLDRAREEVIKNLIKKIEEANCDSISLELLREINLSKLTTK